MESIITFQWEIFIGLEIISVVSLFIFLFLRYAFAKQNVSVWFLVLFILCIVLEAVLALLIYQKTGEVSTFQIVIGLFVVYAFTIGISDFKKLDRYIKVKAGKWRGINLLSEEDMRKVKEAKDPKVIARKNRRWWYVHTLIIFIAHYVFWMYFGNHSHDLSYFLKDLSWWEEEGITNAPFVNQAVQQISKIWMILFAIDTIVSWSYTLFPSKEKE